MLAAGLVAGGAERAYGAQEPPAPTPGPAPGPAPGSAERVIQLRDGTLDTLSINGVILEWVPGSRVTLQLPSGEVRRFRWVDLAPEILPSPPPTAAPSPGSEEAPVEKTRVTLRAKNRYVSLWKNHGPGYVGGYGPYVGSIDVWRIICLPSCNRDLPRAGIFRIGGGNDGLIASTSFELPPGNATFDVRSGGTWNGLVGGVLLTVFGSMASIIGAALFGGAATGVGNFEPGKRSRVGIGGIVTLGVGVGMLTGGIVLLARNHTKVRILDAQGNRVALSPPTRRTLALSPAGLHFYEGV